jgi:hypothetical protein
LLAGESVGDEQALVASAEKVSASIANTIERILDAFISISLKWRRCDALPRLQWTFARIDG